MGNRQNFSIEKYFVVGPENTLGRPVRQMMEAVTAAGFTCIQLRSKVASAREMLALARETADVIAAAGKTEKITLLIDDRLDIALAAREMGIAVDGVHVGQSDVPVAVCRKYLGNDAVIGLSAPTGELFDYLKTTDIHDIDYFGAGPLRPTNTKPDCGLTSDGTIVTRSLEELTALAKVSPLPIVVGGGVKQFDLPALKKTGIDGFFIVSAVSEAADPQAAARALVQTWDQAER